MCRPPNALPGVSAAIVLVFVCLASSLPGENPRQAATAGSGKIRLSVKDSRPLERALDSLQQQYGWLVDYEDPQYRSPEDYVVAPAQPNTPASAAGRRIPSGQEFTVDYPAAASQGQAPDEQLVLRSIVDAYNLTTNPGRFQLRTENPDRFAIVGDAAHDEHGKISSQPIVLDLTIALPNEERSVSDTLDLICQKVTEKSSVPVAMGVYPFGLDHVRATVGGKELPARVLLARAVAGSVRRLCWRLLFDPESKTYVLNLHQFKPLSPPAATSTKP